MDCVIRPHPKGYINRPSYCCGSFSIHLMEGQLSGLTGASTKTTSATAQEHNRSGHIKQQRELTKQRLSVIHLAGLTHAALEETKNWTDAQRRLLSGHASRSQPPPPIPSIPCTLVPCAWEMLCRQGSHAPCDLIVCFRLGLAAACEVQIWLSLRRPVRKRRLKAFVVQGQHTSRLSHTRKPTT